MNRNEVQRSVLRGKLNRLARRTKGYAKSVKMLERLLSLVFLRMLKLNITEIWNTPDGYTIDTACLILLR